MVKSSTNRPQMHMMDINSQRTDLNRTQILPHRRNQRHKSNINSATRNIQDIVPDTEFNRDKFNFRHDLNTVKHKNLGKQVQFDSKPMFKGKLLS